MPRIGRYEVVGEIARGGMGVVLRGRGPDGRDVALKVLLAGAGANETQRARFAREVDALTRLRHPGVVSILDAGHAPQGPWVAMELVDGESLDRRLAREGPLPVPEALRLTEAVARAVEHAHAQGVLHRDLKPANVLVGHDGAPRVTDFGLARAVVPDADAAALSKTGMSLGTPGFWPPEQAYGQRGVVGPRSDVYGLGATLHALLTGDPPYDAPDLLSLLQAMLQPAPPPSARRPGVPPEVDAVVQKALALEPADRWPDVKAFADAVAALRRRPRERRARRGGGVAIGLGLIVVVGAAAAARLGRPVPVAPGRPPAVVAPPAPVAKAPDPDPVDAALKAAAGAFLEGRMEAARAALDAVIAPAPDPVADARCVEALVQRGRTWAAVKDLARAVEDWSRVLAVAPDHHEVRQARATACGALGRFAAVVDDATLLIERRPPGLARGEAHALRAWARTQQGDPRRALDDWREALALVPQADWFVKAASVAAEAGDLDQALPWADQAVARDPGAYAGFMARSAVHVRRGRSDLAERDLDRALDLAPGVAELWVRRSELRKARGDRRGEVDDLTRALGVEPGAADVLRRRAAALQDLGEREASERDWGEALARDPTNVPSWVNRALVRDERGDRQGALADLEEAIRRDDAFAQAYAARAQVRRAAGDHAGARADAEACLRLDPRNPDGWFALARARARDGDAAGAIEAYLETLEHRKDDVPALINCADLLRREGRHAESLPLAERAAELAPSRPEALQVLALCLMNGDGDEAQRRADETWGLYLALREDGLGWRNRGACRENLGDWRGAREAYQKAVALLGPEHEGARFARERLATLDAQGR